VLGGRVVPGQATKEEGVGYPVDDRIKECAPLAGGVLGFGECAVEQIRERSKDDEQ
jgi:hypothetical protein